MTQEHPQTPSPYEADWAVLSLDELMERSRAIRGRACQLARELGRLLELSESIANHIDRLQGNVDSTAV